ncbi:MAG: transcription elongation factor GreB [Methylomonas sp.]|jgi:transcription elongation factor GreB|uniref:transcription elongation factor GreB n=1 Tax=Methylomonas sp. TaxID=418 RepID=UPI0025FD3F23|nr:transcription elongation factor GreB [Methylomonas sp.]MCK9605647.1 transcription elongation factor GreB [Methylomonas sp.]
MSRWRPPRPKSSPYITQAGYKTLEQEMAQLWDRRKHVTAAVSAAAAEGDRSENAEYIYRKKELREIDRRIHYLQKRLPSLTVVSEKPANQNQVFFGAWVTLETMQGDEITYRIVGADEIDTSGGLISLDSPLARALLKKNLDDEVVLNQGDQQRRYYIAAIRY